MEYLCGFETANKTKYWAYWTFTVSQYHIYLTFNAVVQLVPGQCPGTLTIDQVPLGLDIGEHRVRWSLIISFEIPTWFCRCQKTSCLDSIHGSV